MDERPSKSHGDNPEMQTPKMFQPASGVGRQYIFGYSKCIRNANLAMMDLFSDILVVNDDQQAYQIPIIFGSQERAIIYAFGEQFVSNPDRQDKGLIDRVRIPMMALKPGDINFNQDRYVYHEARRRGNLEQGVYGQEKRPFDVIYQFSKGIPIDIDYTLMVWTKYYEHMMQIVEQILQKFSPIAYIKVEGIPWETAVRLEGSSNNMNDDVEDKQVRILKYNFTLKAESHISQPIKRDKTALKITQKHVILGDLERSSEIETIIEEAGENETPMDRKGEDK